MVYFIHTTLPARDSVQQEWSAACAHPARYSGGNFIWYQDDDTQGQILVTGAETGGALGLVGWTLGPFAEGLGSHRHPHHLEGCVVLAGLLAISHGEETSVLSAGQLQLLPPGQAHTYWNPGVEPTRLLLFFAPGDSAALLHRLVRGEPVSGPVSWDTS